MVKLITGVTVEPVTLAEVRAHLRLGDSFADDITTYQALTPMSRAANTYTSAGVLVVNKSAIVNLNSGLNQNNGTLNVHIEESDDNITYADWTTGAFTEVTTANDNAIYEKQYTGLKQYIRVVAVVAVAACEFSIDFIISSGDITEDVELAAFITAAREYGEDYTSRAFATQTFEQLMDWWCINGNYGYIDIEKPPLQSITSVKYKNSSAVETTLTADTDYIVDTDSNIGRIVLPYGKNWVTFTPYTVNPIRIRFVAGYTTLPANFKNAMLVHIGLLYKNRDEGIPDSDMKTVHALYNMRRSHWF